MGVLGALVLVVITTLPPQQGFYCRWGEPAKSGAMPGCGVPRRIRTPLPVSGKRLEFRKADNPGLGGYFIRRKDGTGPLKRMRNLVNLYAVDLFLCPKDFETPKTLLFHLKTGSGWKPVQCKLGPEVTTSMGKLPMGGVSSSESGTSAAQDASNIEKKAIRSLKNESSKSTTTKKTTGPVTKVLDLPSCVAPKKDPFARILGWTALGMAVVAFLLALVAIRRASRRHTEERDEE